MTTAQTIIQQALREGNLIPVGVTPTAVQLSEGLDRLNNLIDGLFGNEVGEPLFEWPVPPPQQTSPVNARWPLTPGVPFEQRRMGDAWPYPPCNVRLMASNSGPETVYLQHMPNDGARVGYTAVGASDMLTLDGNGRRIDGAPTYVVDPTDQGGIRLWFYRGDLGQWIEIKTLALTDESPLPKEFDDFLITGLCIRLSSRYGNDPRDGTVKTYTDQLRKLQARYRQPTAALGGSDQAPNSWQAFVQGSSWGGPV